MVVSAERQGEPQPRMTTTLQSRPTHPMTGDPAVGSTAWVGSPTRIVALSGGKDSTAMALKRERDIEAALARADDASALAIPDGYDPEHHLITLAAEVRRLRGSPDAEPPLPPATCSAIARDMLQTDWLAMHRENQRLRAALERIAGFPVHSEPVGGAYAMQDIANEALSPNPELRRGGEDP